MAPPQRILIVTGEEAFPRAELERRQLSTTAVATCDQAYAQLLGAPFELVIVDMAGGGDGVEFIRRVRNEPRLTGILILALAEWGTGEPTLALSAGADAFEPGTVRSIEPERLYTSIEGLLNRQVGAAKLTNL